MIESRDGKAAKPAVLQLVPSLNSGGAERSTIEIAAALARSGFTPLVASEGGRMVRELEAAGGEWIPMPLDAKSPFALVANAGRIANLVRRRSVALVHARSRAPAWSALWAARRTGTPFVATWHGAYSGENALKRYYNSVMLRGDAVIANSRWTAEQIRSYSRAPRKLAIIPRGVDLQTFDRNLVPERRIEELRASWSVPRGGLVILCPGRMSRRKGQLVLIEAMAKLARRGVKQLYVVLAGEAASRDGYVAEIRDAATRNALSGVVVFAGHVSEMAAAYAAADIAVAASLEPEGFGRVAAEAGAMGCAVIATDHGGARETVCPGVSGLLVPPGDAVALAAAIGSLVAAGAEGRAKLGEGGREFVRRNFTLARMTSETLALYRDVLASHAAGAAAAASNLLA